MPNNAVFSIPCTVLKSLKHTITALTVITPLLWSFNTQAADRTAPPTAKIEVTDRYHGVEVSDAYRWLEQNNDETRAWGRAQDSRTRQYLDKLPARQAIAKRLQAQNSLASKTFFDLHLSGDKVFALSGQPGKQQPVIALLNANLKPETARIIVDPNRINPKGSTAIDWYVPSPDGKLVAVSLSENGSEDGTLHIFDVATGKKLKDVIPRVQYGTAGGSLAWRADGSGFWYTRYPGPERPAEEQHFFQQVYTHKLGDDPAKDAYVVGKDFPKVAIIVLDNSFNHDYLTISVANGDGGEFAQYVIDPQGNFKQVSRFEDKVVAAVIAPDAAMYLISNQDAPRGKLMKLAKGDYDLSHAKVIVPESDGVMQGGGEFGGTPLIVTKKAIYVREIVGGPSRVSIFDHDGKRQGELPLADVASVNELLPMSDGTVLYSVRTYLKPFYYARYDETTGKVGNPALARTSPLKFDDVEVVREFATSKDGTRIPLTVVRRKGIKLDGSHPLLLNGYGGYNVSQTPSFLGASTRLWLDAGGVYVVANLRGGGEFGEQWHQQGMLTKKQNVFDDFIASAEYLVQANYTRNERMSAIGGSNGGLLMGAVFTQRPELFRAVVSQVGIYDMLRVELDPNGTFNITEFGSVQDPEQFKAMYAYSPYHHVVEGARYPAIFMSTGETDARVNPMHSRKMIAKMQAATASPYPILLSTNAKAGHGIGSSVAVRTNQSADVYSFLFDQLGMKMPKAK